MPIKINDIIIFSTGGTICYLIKILIDHFLIKSRNKESVIIKNSNDACVKLRDIFNKTLANLYICKNAGYDKSLWNMSIDYAIQAEAIESYRFFVPDSKKEEYQKAWDDYHSYMKLKESLGIQSNEEFDIIEHKILDIINFTN